MTHETAVLLARACQYIEADLVAAVKSGNPDAIIEHATGAMLLRHVVKYVVEGEESYGRS